MQQRLPVPAILVRSTYAFENSGVRQRWRERNFASRGSISVISFRIVNLRAAFKNGDIKDPRVVRMMALEIDADLDEWRVGLPPSWSYTTTHATVSADVADCFNGARHRYASLWIAEVWNNWRALRVLVNQILVQSESGYRRLPSNTERTQTESLAISRIQDLSTDICVSVASFAGTPRK